MKKLLALVLALVMTLSLCVTSNAAYTDAADVNYDEAVDVMTAIGVFNGTDGKFNPKDVLTREQAAKIVTYMLLGKSAADALVTIAAPFADVAADRWSAGSIAYCYNEGILAGVGEGKFAPTAQLTGLAFAKMMLVALGYDAEVEGLTGANWSINAAKLALTVGLTDDLDDVVLSQPMTREQAAQMAFNTELATMVKYDDSTTITAGNVTIKTQSAAKAQTWANNKGYDYKGTNSTANDSKEFCEVYAPKLKLSATAVDSYYSSSDTWSYKGTKIGSYKGAADIVYTADMDSKDGKAAIKADIKDFNNYNKNTDIDLYKNGHPEADIKLTEANIAALTGNGTVVELYVTDNGVTKVVVKEAVVAKVTAVSEKNETLTLSVQSSASGTFGYVAGATTLTTDEGYGTFKKDDYVLVMAYNTSSNTVTSATVTDVSALEVVTGLATKKTSSKITLDGTEYKTAEAVVAGDFAVNSKYDAKLYLDSYGYIAYAKSGSAAVTDKAVAVLKAYQSLNKDGEMVWMVKGVTSNGEIVVWEAAADYRTMATANNVRVYSETDDVYTIGNGSQNIDIDTANMEDGDLSELINDEAIASNAKTLTTDHGQKLYFDSNVKFIYVNGTKATVKDGVQKVESGTEFFVTVKVKDTVPYITAVFVRAAATNTIKSSDQIVFVDFSTKTADGYSLTDKDGKVQKFDTYTAYINGEKLDLFYTADTVTADGFYKIETDADNGDYVLTGNDISTGDNDELSVSAEETYTALVGDLLTGSNDYDISGAKFVDLTGNDYTCFAEVKTDIEDAGNTDVDGAKFMVIYDYDEGVASYVYLTAIVNS